MEKTKLTNVETRLSSQLSSREQEMKALQARMQASYQDHVAETQRLNAKVGPHTTSGAGGSSGPLVCSIGLGAAVGFFRYCAFDGLLECCEFEVCSKGFVCQTAFLSGSSSVAVGIRRATEDCTLVAVCFEVCVASMPVFECE